MDTEKEIEEHQNGDQEAIIEEEAGSKTISCEDVADTQGANSREDNGVKEEKGKKIKLSNIAYWIMILTVIAFCIFLFFYLTSNGKDCLSDPLKFYGEKMQQECFCITP
jgi:hypothetical protein